jgi:colanic acid/amylovoran biosynthesis glycosyltransferase
MRIAIFVSSFPTVSETFVLNQITGLIDLGHDVSIFARGAGDLQRLHPDVTRYRLLSRTHYWPWMPHGKTKRAVKAALLFARFFPQHPGPMMRLVKTRVTAPPTRTELLYCGIPLVGRGPYDAVLCHFGHNGNRAAALRDLGVMSGRLATIFHAVDVTRYVSQTGRDVYARLFRTGDLFLPISERWKQLLIELGCPKDRIMVHHMGIDCTRFAFQPRRLSPDGVIRILSIARLVEKKGIEYAIRAVAQLMRDGVALQYSIVGDGPLREKLAALAAECGASIRFLGSQPQDQIRELLNRAHVFLAPSVTAADGDQEGIPVSIMEAMAVGLPVVSTWHSGIPELVTHGVSGWLVPERDIEALTANLRQVASRPDSWATMGAAGRTIVERDYNVSILNARLAQLLAQGGGLIGGE